MDVNSSSFTTSREQKSRQKEEGLIARQDEIQGTENGRVHC